MPDYYAIGIEEVGIYSPQNVLDEMNLVNDAINALDRVIQPSDKARPEFKASWITYRDTWKKFYDAHSGWTGWFSRAPWTETMDQVLEYSRRTRAWQDAVTKEGLMLPGPGPLVEREDKTKTYLLYGGLVIGGIIVAYGLGKYALGRLFSIGED